MIRLNCFYQAHTGCYDKALEAAITLTALSQQHAGCIAYDVFESATRPDIFCIVETWADQASLDAHSATPEFAQYVGILNECGKMSIEQMER
ncbi:MAG: antibiotic biosynthesis monooxygenase [Bacteroidaceae bacterium]|nr:antibiotic biosynthesis monooxygenase [Bacteroidaceae bacterium]MCF0196387.1 antibiotic biosynthesis monooxygenase [Bacteroidaceae bacterium]